MSKKSEVQNPKSKVWIKFVGKVRRLNKKTGRMKMFPSEPHMVIINGAKMIFLPPADEQRKGFTHEDAEYLLETYPRLYKKISRKGK